MTNVDTDTRLLAILATLDDRLESALACSGLEDSGTAAERLARGADLQAGMDSDELENYGAAVALHDAIALIRAIGVLQTVDGHVGDLQDVALAALDGMVALEGPGSDLHDAAEGCAALLRSVEGKPAHPSDLLYLAGQAVEQACEQSSAAGSAVVPVRGDNYEHSVWLKDVAPALKQAANSSAIR